MKLYFYFLDNPGSSDAMIRCEACKVIEKEKTYVPVDSFPSGYEHYRYYIKRRLGRIECNLVRKVMVVMDKPDWQRAKQAFMNYCDHERRDIQKRIDKAEEQLDNMWSTTNYVAAWEQIGCFVPESNNSYPLCARSDRPECKSCYLQKDLEPGG